MGKKKNKKNKNNDFWGGALDSKDQMKGLDIIADIESGKKKGKVTDIFGLSTEPIRDENGLPSGLIDKISQDMNLKPEKEEGLSPESILASVMGVPGTSAEEEVHEEYVPAPTPAPVSCNIKEDTEDEKCCEECEPFKNVRFCVKEELCRLEITDGVVPVSLYIPSLLQSSNSVVQIDESEYDADQLGEDISLIYHYIISSKHPAAMFTIDEFVDKMERVKSYNTEKYIFMLLEDKYILAYKVEYREDFTNYMINKLNYTPLDVLKCYIGAAYLTCTVHSAFFVETAEYLEAFLESSYNHRETFMDDFINDLKTILTIGSEEREHEYIDVQALQSTARIRIDEIVGDDIDDDEYYEDDEDEEETLEAAQETIVEEETKVPESDIEDVEDLSLDEVETSVEESHPEIEVIKPTEDESMVVPVRTKKS